MTENQSKLSIKAAKPMTTIYVALMLAVIVLIVMSSVFAGLVIDYRLRLAFLVSVACFMMLILGAEIARLLYKAGITPIGFIGILATNLMLATILFAVFVDMMGTDVENATSTLLGSILLGGIVWSIIIAILPVITWLRSRRSNTSE
ncbi:MAG: hypothetical protein RTU30_03470 [Candidatus Thorarchaeota archaeon]